MSFRMTAIRASFFGFAVTPKLTAYFLSSEGFGFLE
jgi:hypothetical protein